MVFRYFPDSKSLWFGAPGGVVNLTTCKNPPVLKIASETGIGRLATSFSQVLLDKCRSDVSLYWVRLGNHT